MRDTNQYVVQGVRRPSVTECLRLGGLHDYAGVPREVLIHAAARGREVHAWCDLEDTGEIPDGASPDEEIAPYLSAYRTFKHELGFELIAHEMVVRNHTYGYAGTLDRLCYLRRSARFPMDPTVIDIKTIAMLSPVTRLQVAGYYLALRDSDPTMRNVRRGSVQLRRDGRYRWQYHEDPSDEHDFLSAVRLAQFQLRHNLANLEEISF